MRYLIILIAMVLGFVTSAISQVSIGIGLPNVSIGINLPVYPELVRVPGYPVYYAPRLNSNFFFYDGMYWVYQEDNWYASSWYNGPWGLVAPEFVPLFVLRIPVRYYRVPPVYFRGWRSDAPPRWGEHWGNEWQQHKSGWDQWNRRSSPAPAPLPLYQRQYSGDRYPQVEQQRELQSQKYRYQPRDAVVRQHYQEQVTPKAPASLQRGDQGRSVISPRAQAPQQGREEVQRAAPAQIPSRPRAPAVQDQRQQQQQQQPQGAAQREQQNRPSSQENMPNERGPQESRRGQGQEKDREKGEGRGPDRNR
jgi:hypothetical protein